MAYSFHVLHEDSCCSSYFSHRLIASYVIIYLYMDIWQLTVFTFRAFTFERKYIQAHCIYTKKCCVCFWSLIRICVRISQPQENSGKCGYYIRYQLYRRLCCFTHRIDYSFSNLHNILPKQRCLTLSLLTDYTIPALAASLLIALISSKRHYYIISRVDVHIEWNACQY